MTVNIRNYNSHFSDPNTRSQINAIIAELDPLKSDLDIARLPDMNSSKDIKSIICTLERLIPSHQQIEEWSINEACAAMRDLGMFNASIKRHGLEPLEVIPQQESVLLKLGAKTNMVPRDTLIHYTLWNPDDERKRRYTSHLDETKMIQSSKIAIPKLEMAIYQIMYLHEIPFDSPYFIKEFQKCATYLNGMVEGIVYTIKNVSRKVFAEDLRLFFDSFIIQGKEYLGPGAVEMPLLIFDHFLWSSECQDKLYLKYKRSFIPYFLPEFRRLYINSEFTPSLLSKFIYRLNNTSVFDKNLVASANELTKLFKILIKFRKPHIKVVDEAYAGAENRQRELGSGGYEYSTLNYLSDLTEDAISRLKNAINTNENSRYSQMIS